MFNADHLNASFGGAGGGVGLAAFSDNLGSDTVAGKIFLYLAPVGAVAFAILMSWIFVKLEQREIRNQNAKAIATVEMELGSQGISLERKQELQQILKSLKDEKIAHRL
ncbi:hypothetical protein SSP35_12_00490 [Streptomyces sp. NBRC 110611]|uniref:hypothetical protein n=1 Tax=Streptomyces sp. NBRC 110611 TaxID=1621259 RepID=UPI000856125E|nr:hypothetical protein [Streptomyces sp. NBRC 110611]GAU69401.1 hypothetical protein SSP35_12_00490 [Streptomyces sp. NBRC 110611]